jgi:hypothetical protein
MLRDLALACVLLGLMSPSASRAEASRYVAPRVPLGVNLPAVHYYATAIPFLDLFRMAGEPFSTNAAWTDGDANAWDSGLAARIPRRPDGYPRAMPVRVKGAKVPQILRYPVATPLHSGRYVVRYQGDGELRFAASQVQVVTSAPGRLEVDVKAEPGARLFLDIARSSAKNPVRDVRIVPAAHENAQAGAFDPEFLTLVRGASVLRFMDWGQTNGSRIKRFSERAAPDGPQGSARGVAYEHMLALTRAVSADPWIAVPHRADDDHVRRLGALLKARLAPGQRVYVELSNELWNGLFSQAQEAREAGCKAGLAKLGEYANPRGCVDDSARYWAGIKWNARRAGQVFALLDKVFAKDRARVVRVLAGQSGFAEELRVLLASFENPRINTAKAQADALAIAPYFGVNLEPGADGALPRETADSLLDRLERVALPNALAEVKAHAELARAHGLALVAYEGGQHLVALGPAAEDAALVAAIGEANRSPRMGALYERYLEGFLAASPGSLMNLFTLVDESSKYGAWGLTESQTQPHAPKLDAYRKVQARLDSAR